MQITEKLNKDLVRSYEIAIPAKDVAETTNQKATEIAKDIKLDGFRKGKVPTSVVVKLYGESLKKDVLENLIQKASTKIIKENKFKLATQPNISVESFDDKNGVKFKIEMELYPEIPDLDLNKITYTDYTFTPNKKELDEAVKKLQSMHKELKETKKGTKAKEGDTILIDFTGYIDDKEFPGGSAKDYKLDIGNGHFIPGFETGLIDCEEGEEKTLDLKFPKDYGSAQHAGKKVKFKVLVKKIYSQILPKIDDEFAKKLHLTDVKDLNEKIEEAIKGNYNQIKRNLVKKELFDELEKIGKFKLPEQMVKREFDLLIAQAEKASDHGKLSKEEKAKQEKLYHKIAERRIKLGIILSELAQREKVSVEQQDVNKIITQQARQMPGQEQAIIDYYKKTPNAIDNIKGQILEEKVVDHLITKLNKKEKKVTTEELIELAKNIDAEYSA